MEGEKLFRPRIVDTAKYVKDRISQIAELLEVVDNSMLTPGEVTSRKRTMLQRLPRHMRRRAMSHNIKRLPKMVRNLATNAVRKAKHRKKPPSRKWRRRPSRLLKRHSRLLRKFNWLETHIWHAKRFLMTDLWGYKLPIRSYQKGFRPTYRNAMNSAAVFDQSFLECIQIVSFNSQEETSKLLSSFCVSGVSPSFGFKSALNGCLEINVLLYAPNQYPHGFLGPGRFSWSSVNDSNQLQLWVHPSNRVAVLDCVVKIFGAKPSDSRELQKEEKIGGPKRVFGKFSAANKKIHYTNTVTPTTFVSSTVKILDLSHDLVRIQLVGPKALSLLQCALRLVSTAELDILEKMKSYRASHEFWTCNVNDAQPGNFRNGSVISLLVEDPRLFRAGKQRQAKKFDSCPSHCYDVPTPCALFWDRSFREQQMQNRLSSKQLVKKMSENLESLKSTPFKVPIILVIRNVMTNKGNASANRVDLIAPGGTGLDFWLALQFADGRAAGLQDKIHLDFEAGLTSFPSDCADSQAGLTFGEIDSAARLARHLKKPENRQLDYDQSLHVRYPFSFEWYKLVEEWNNITGPKHDIGVNDTCYVLRDRRVLISLSNWLEENTVNVKVEDILKVHSRALVPLKLEQLSRGTPKRLALICLPSEQDLLLVEKDKNSIILEHIGRDKIENQVHKENDEKVLADYIPLRLEPGEKLVSLNEMFPDQRSARHNRNVKRREKHKWSAKRKKFQGDRTCVLGNKELEEELQVVDSGLPSPQCLSYRNSCSRTVIGRVVRGDYSFVNAQGFCFGYCPLAVLQEVQNRLVLLRNATSKYYHPAKISIHIQPYDL